MCVCEAIGTRKSIKLAFIHTVSTFHCFYALNFRQSPWMIEICRIQVHAGTPHIFCLTTTSIPCVFLKQQAPENRSNWRLYTRSLHFTAFMLSTSSTVLQSMSFAEFKFMQVPHTYSVWQPPAYHVHLCRNKHPKIAQIHGCICVFHYFYALNFRQSASITQLCWIQVHTGNPHIFCLTIASLTCVSVWNLWPNKYPKIAQTHEMPP